MAARLCWRLGELAMWGKYSLVATPVTQARLLHTCGISLAADDASKRSTGAAPKGAPANPNPAPARRRLFENLTKAVEGMNFILYS